MESNKLFAETPPFKLFIRAALPGAIAMLASMLYDTADGILVGRYLGQESFGAVTIAIPLVILCFAVADLIGVGASAVIAVEHGKKNHQTANNIFYHCLYHARCHWCYQRHFLLLLCTKRFSTDGCSRKDCRTRNYLPARMDPFLAGYVHLIRC